MKRPATRLLASLTVVLGAVALAAPPAAATVPSPAAVRAGEWWLGALHVRQAWVHTRGAGVIVAIADTGVDAQHPDLRGALVPGKDFTGTGAPNGEAPVTSGQGAGLPFKDPHGTAMAGFVVGRGHGAGHALGMIGVAPAAKAMSVSFGPGAQAAAAIRYAADHGAKVINLSFGTQNVSALKEAVRYAESKDVVLVAATGNNGGPMVTTPADYPGVIAVSGITNASGYPLDPESDYGPPEVNNPLRSVDDVLGGTALVGPFSNHSGQQDMPSLTPTAKGSYAVTGGTSNAAAVVSGVVALVRSRYPQLSAADVITQLLRTAYHPAGTPRWSQRHGFGIPDAAKAVTERPLTGCKNPLGSLATNDYGVWVSLAKNPDASISFSCSGSDASSSPAASTPASSAPNSAPAAHSTAPAQAGSSSGGGVPGWVWPLVAVAVLGAVLITVLLVRSRGRRRGPPGPPGGYQPPGYPTGPPPSGPDPGGYPPPATYPAGTWSPPPPGR